MNEQFDRALRNHIRDTFDHYDDLMADDGWKKFSEIKNKKRRGLLFWYGLPSGIAAALALLWVFNMTTTEVLTPNVEKITINETYKTPDVKRQKSENFEGKPAKTELEQQKSKRSVGSNEYVMPNKSLSLRKSQNKEQFEDIPENRQQIALIQTEKIDLQTAENEIIQSSLTLKNFDLEEISVKPIPIIDNKEYLAFNNSLLKNADSYNKPTIEEEKKTEKTKTRKFKFSVDANTYYSFTTAGVTDDLNLGLGFLSELKLTKNLSVNSGISLNKQTTRYVDNANSVTENKSFARAAFSNQPVSVPDELETSAKLVGFEIPLNLKYGVAIGKLKTFITSGVSSYSLLNQSYTNDLSVINYSISKAPTTTVVREVDKETKGAFSNFQFARTVNFSFGVLYPVSSKNTISVEPFLKYPIAGFGSKNLEIGSGGISFKLNFGR